MGRTVAFFSYTRKDDESCNGRLSLIRLALEQRLRAQLGDWEAEVFQDVDDIQLGDEWERRLHEALDMAPFLIPILTPGYFRSDACMMELARFREREKDLGRSDLILPILWIKGDGWGTGEPDDARGFVLGRQYADWTELNFSSVDDTLVSDRAQRLAVDIAKRYGALNADPIQPEPAPGPASPPAPPKEIEKASRPASLKIKPEGTRRTWFWPVVSMSAVGAGLAFAINTAIAPPAIVGPADGVTDERPSSVTDLTRRNDPIVPPPELLDSTDRNLTPPADVSAFAGWTSCGSPGRLGQGPASDFSIPTYPEAKLPAVESGRRLVGARAVTDPTDFPWMVKLGIFGDRTDPLGRPLRGECGGVIVDESWVLTATHCLVDVINGTMSGPTSVTVSYGGLTLQSDLLLPQRVEADKALCASNYPFSENDIAILRLREPIRFSNTIQPARLPTPEVDQFLRGGGLFEVTATGFGFTATNSFSLDLLQVDIPIDHFKNGGTTIVSDVSLSTGAVCLVTSGIPAHFEDPSAQGFGRSGIERTVVGISSFTRSGSETFCKFYGTKTGFTRVGPYVERIERAIAACPPAPQRCPALDKI